MLVQRNYELKQPNIQFAFQQQLKEKKHTAPRWTKELKEPGVRYQAVIRVFQQRTQNWRQLIVGNLHLESSFKQFFKLVSLYYT